MNTKTQIHVDSDKPNLASCLGTMLATWQLSQSDQKSCSNQALKSNV